MISGVVLAAGEGTRFGATKQVHQVEAIPMAQHAIDALSAAGVGDLIVVTTGRRGSGER
jgi:CTP:molybdopterin cytidylyltransferase MocA